MEMKRPARVFVLNVSPSVDCGRFPIKRIVHDTVTVSADLVADGHDVVRGRLAYRVRPDGLWQFVPLAHQGNDRYQGTFKTTTVGVYEYRVEGYIDAYATWRERFEKKRAINQDLPRELAQLAQIIAQHLAMASSLPEDVRIQLAQVQQQLESLDVEAAADVATSKVLQDLMLKVQDDQDVGRSEIFLVRVDRPRALFGAWYEFFPRSCAREGGRHGTFAESEPFLEYVAGLGFDVVYLPPIHPIGTIHRKGVNNHTTAKASDPGSPWAIGSAQGGHLAIEPSLGTLADFDHFHQTVRQLGMELAMDITFQCAPDHPWVQEHPEWFSHFPDGSIQYAENPPKKYEDVYPLNFDTPAWQALWEALKDVVKFWADRGVRIFRVDNPHTKPLAFWEWLIGQIQAQYPDAIFLSEAFTRPKLMYALSKAGFSQSYTYFAWRNTPADLRQYLMELTRTEVKEFFRPNFWPNTPDILPEFLQTPNVTAFAIRLILAATLAASYGIYGPAYELLESRPVRPGSEEYDHSEKYEIRHWDLSHTPNLQHLIRQVNAIRHQEAALHNNHSLEFHGCDNPMLLVYSKQSQVDGRVLLMVVNTDPVYTQSGWTALNMQILGMADDAVYIVHDLLTDARYEWRGPYNYVELRPDSYNAHIFRIEAKEGI
ncbi:alpha-1,4-glucan--maltose-1-phosphate maltosyltransferase [Sulfobacillus sp. hq2]|uniref:alpha-1,4-glucan--maltose-1-phosphate maltosyltransferase n=1 Tax=Sulfobacillus sp. hq2 TaxID=2039167 RepID=UPI000CD27904|nr:alpha-1,4-glucan--maltose-1-phosphate maltosyltransferase [Sulfobacillus sp. hq2]POB09139.1 alpha-1,4-glucan--maltose-1-phosphate maltosyltransferase [Sulfobacillus sp. hq2]